MASRKAPKTLRGLAFAEIERLLTDLFEKGQDLDPMQLKKELYENLPPSLHEKMTSVCLSACEGVTIKEDLTRQIATLVAGPGVKVLDLSEPLHCFIFERLHELTSIYDLDCISIKAPRLSMTHLQNLICNSGEALKNLIDFSIGEQCSDKILLHLGKSCPQLRHLTVCNSPHVTDACFGTLSNCQRLKTVDMDGNKRITEHGLFRLLTESKAPELKRVSLGGYLGELRSQLLTLLDRSSLGGRTFPMEVLVFDQADSEQVTRDLELARKYFPSLQIVKFYDEAIPDLSPLLAFERIEDLTFEDVVDFSSSFARLQKYLNLRGSSLTELNIGTDEVFPAILMRDIMRKCPNLETLSVRADGDDLEDAILPCSELPMLKDFECEGVSIKLIITVLKYARNIERIKVYDLNEENREASENMIEKLLDKIIRHKLLQQVLGLGVPIFERTTTLKKMIKIVEILEKLRVIWIWNFDSTERNTVRIRRNVIPQLESFIKSNNYRVSVVVHDERKW